MPVLKYDPVLIACFSPSLCLYMQAKHKFWQLSFWSQTWALTPVKQRRTFVILILVHVLLTAWYNSKQGVFFDEPDYFNYTYRWAKGDPSRFAPIMDSKTPMMFFSLVPGIIKPLLPEYLLAQDVFFYLKAGRPFMYIYAMLAAFIVFCWVGRIVGPKKWVLLLLLFCFDPLVFAYGMVIGSDLASAALLVTCMYTAWRFSVTENQRYWWLLSIAAALAIVTKASMIYLYPLLLFLFGYRYYLARSLSLKRTLLQLLVFIVIQLLVINAAYYGKGIFTSFGAIHFTSKLFSDLQASLNFFAGWPVPLPAAFVQGLDMLQQHAEYGGCKPDSTYGGVWIFNKVYCNTSVWYYYIATALFKFPLLIWLLIFATIARFFQQKTKLQVINENVFLWLPVIYFLCILSFANKFQIGLRHAMILMPFLYIGISSTVITLVERYKPVFFGLILLHLISVVRYLPNLIAYTNELVWNKTMAYKIVKDSSLDYGQSDPWVKTFIEKNPEYKIPGNIPATGKFAIPVNKLFAEHEGPQKNIAWLRENFEPVANYRYTILLFEVTAADLKAKGLPTP
ncbi:MAG: hypothetical protein V4717_05840 [Bacteroidota bacterium]